MKFIDIAEIYVKAGDGGAGHVSFRREKYVPKGGPDGGDGGKGGNVIIQANKDMNTLLDYKFKQKFLAQDGEKGGRVKRSGKDGKHIKIKVPVGTMIFDAQTDELITDLIIDKQKVVIAKGGKGGMGNMNFATPTNRSPRYAQPGIPGPELFLRLELKLLADVGIIGFPNVGKSTLISVISAAKPKIADYPFTTLVPNLGVVKIDEFQSYSVADVPGLIQGASEGKGLGIQFLRHIERTKILLFVLDATSEDIKKDYKILSKELEKFNPEMLYKKRMICLSKCDTLDQETVQALTKLKLDPKAGKPLIISSVTNLNINELKFKLWDLLLEFKQDEENSLS
ncbi:MAG: GTPase ObgE [Ignavibacteria bacterium GWF2_33_9]|nr:MAG: GTPase ObgE [Ignavibacteria bacterium GWF2_33_9]